MVNLSTLFKTYSKAKERADAAFWHYFYTDDTHSAQRRRWVRYSKLEKKLYNKILARMKAGEEFSKGLIWFGGYKDNPARLEEQDE
jgi:hypothetical protein